MGGRRGREAFSLASALSLLLLMYIKHAYKCLLSDHLLYVSLYVYIFSSMCLCVW